MTGLIALLLLMAPGGAAASPELCAPPSSAQLVRAARQEPIDGAFVVYRIQGGKGSSRDGFLRLQVVRSAWNGSGGRWLEGWFDEEGRTAIRIRLDDEGPGIAHLKLGGTYFALSAPEARAAASAGGKADWPQRCEGESGRAPARNVRLHTAAGTIVARRQFLGHGASRIEIWTSAQVPVTGLARLRAPGRREWELVRMGGGAKSAFAPAFEPRSLPLGEGLQALLGTPPGI